MNFLIEKLKRSTIPILVILTYFVVFEYIIPVNKYFPKGSLIWESFLALFTEYHILNSIAITTTIIYLALTAGYFIFKFLYPYVFNKITDKTENKNFIPEIFKYIPNFVLIILFVFWFKSSFFAELVFILIFIVSLLIKLSREKDLSNLKNFEMFIENNSLDLKLLPKISFKLLHKQILDGMANIHVYTWLIVLIYEFISNSMGIGSKFQEIFNNYDLSAFFALSILLSFLIWIGDYLYRIIKTKLIN